MECGDVEAGAVATAHGESSHAQAFGAPSWWGAAGPVIGLCAQLLLIAVLGRTVGLNSAGWVVGVTCAVGMSAGLALGLSHFGSERLAPADWITLTRGTLALGVAALVADSLGQFVPLTLLVSPRTPHGKHQLSDCQGNGRPIRPSTQV